MSDWLEVGWALYEDGVRNVCCFSPLGHRQAQRWWLGGGERFTPACGQCRMTAAPPLDAEHRKEKNP